MRLHQIFHSGISEQVPVSAVTSLFVAETQECKRLSIWQAAETVEFLGYVDLSSRGGDTCRRAKVWSGDILHGYVRETHCSRTLERLVVVRVTTCHVYLS